MLNITVISIHLDILDKEMNKIGKATGFILNHDGTAYLTTCWHVVTCQNHLDRANKFNQPNPNNYAPYLIKCCLPLISANSITTSNKYIIGINHELPIYSLKDGIAVPLWQENKCRFESEEKPVGDVVCFKLDIRDKDGNPEKLEPFGISRDFFYNEPVKLGQKLFVCGYPRGVASSGAFKGIGFAKTVFVAATDASIAAKDEGKNVSFNLFDGFFIDGTTSRGMSGSPVFNESVLNLVETKV
ncbi:MAG: trypsin-like peptidase domain-containing protein [Nitrospinae bacterium]|nr:trypsin-like peptidase domain-containing protein [Nitrospinota bacterium]